MFYTVESEQLKRFLQPVKDAGQAARSGRRFTSGRGDEAGPYKE
jgi:hypothetical protein